MTYSCSHNMEANKCAVDAHDYVFYVCREDRLLTPWWWRVAPPSRCRMKLDVTCGSPKVKGRIHASGIYNTVQYSDCMMKKQGLKYMNLMNKYKLPFCMFRLHTLHVNFVINGYSRWSTYQHNTIRPTSSIHRIKRLHGSNLKESNKSGLFGC